MHGIILYRVLTFTCTLLCLVAFSLWKSIPLYIHTLHLFLHYPNFNYHVPAKNVLKHESFPPGFLHLLHISGSHSWLHISVTSKWGFVVQTLLQINYALGMGQMH